MKFLQRHRVALLCGLLLAALALAACAPNPQDEIISPELGQRIIVARAAGAVVAVEPTPMPLLANLSEDQIYAGLEADLADAVKNGNPDNGATLALANGCIGCHALDPAAQMTGPTWHNIGDTAVGRMPGMSPGQYLANSILNPNEFVVADYPGGVMPQTYTDTLSTQDLGDLVAYLLAQNGQP